MSKAPTYMGLNARGEPYWMDDSSGETVLLSSPGFHWQPIDTAPKEKWVLLLRSAGGIRWKLFLSS